MQARRIQHEVEWNKIDPLFGDDLSSKVIWITCDHFEGRQQLIASFTTRYPVYQHVHAHGTGFQLYEESLVFDFLKDTGEALIDTKAAHPAVLHLTHLEAYLPVLNKFAGYFWNDLEKEKEQILQELPFSIVIWTHSYCFNHTRTRHPLLLRSLKHKFNFLPLQRNPYPHSPRQRYASGYSEKTDLINAAWDFMRVSKFDEALSTFANCVEWCLEEYEYGDAMDVACLATQLLIDLQRYEEAAKALILTYNMDRHNAFVSEQKILERLRFVFQKVGLERKRELLYDLFDFGASIGDKTIVDPTIAYLNRDWRHRLRSLDDNW